MSDAQFPFPVSPKRAVFTLRQVVHAQEPILFVVRDEDDGDWQFLNGKFVYKKDMLIVSLEEILLHDPTLHSLSNLPRGWKAFRKSTRHAWQREEILVKNLKPKTA
jgi:hypothetical protein